MNRYYFHLWTGHAYEMDETGIKLLRTRRPLAWKRSTAPEKSR